jgi:hypothetical protein
MKNVFASVVSTIALLATTTACKKTGESAGDSGTASIDSYSECKPGLFRWMCKPKTDLLFAVKFGDGYCLYKSSFKGATPDERAKQVKDLFSNERFTQSYPQPHATKFSRNTLLARISDGGSYIKDKFHDAVRDELSHADKTPGRVNVDVKTGDKAPEDFFGEFTNWLETAFFSADSGGATGKCPPPRELQKSR